jgi:hypothetical protein
MTIQERAIRILTSQGINHHHCTTSQWAVAKREASDGTQACQTTTTT